MAHRFSLTCYEGGGICCVLAPFKRVLPQCSHVFRLKQYLRLYFCYNGKVEGPVWPDIEDSLACWRDTGPPLL